MCCIPAESPDRGWPAHLFRRAYVVSCRRGGVDVFQPLSSVPCISLDRAVPGIPSIIKNDYQGMYDALAHLIEVHDIVGCLLQGTEKVWVEPERYRAYTDALRAYGYRSTPSSYLCLPAGTPRDRGGASRSESCWRNASSPNWI